MKGSVHSTMKILLVATHAQMLMEIQVKFRSPQNISGASQ